MDPADDRHAAVRPALLAEVLRRFGRARVRATGTSMRPAIQPGDILLIAQCPPAEIARGDVVVTTRGARLFAHRVVECAGPGGSSVVTRGDSNWHTDPAVGVDDILGKVTTIHRGDSSSLPARPSRLRRARGLIFSECIRAFRLGRALLPFRSRGRAQRAGRCQPVGTETIITAVATTRRPDAS